jgi:ammonium transporter, Amt family
LVGITPCAGWVNDWGAMAVGAIDTVIVWFAWNYLVKVRPFSKVDDALGVIYTHGIAGLFGGLMLGIFADPNMIEYGCGTVNANGQVINTSTVQYATASKSCVPFSAAGLMYTGSFHQLWEQARAALWVILWSAGVTFILMKLIGLVLHGARYSDDILEIGDLAIHDEEAFPEDRGMVRSDLEFAGGGGSISSMTTDFLPPPDPGGQLFTRW